MGVSVAIKPAPLAFSKVMIYYQLNYSSMTAGDRLQFELYDTDSISTLAQVEYVLPSAAGSIHMEDVQNMLDAYLNYVLPANLVTSTGVCEETRDNYANVRLRWRQIAPSTTSWADVSTSDFKVMKGGMGSMAFYREFYTNLTSFSAAKSLPRGGSNFLTWVPSGRKMAQGEFGWLYYLHLGTAAPTVNYLVTYKSGTTSLITAALPNTYAAADYSYRTWHIPCGVNQCNLDPSGLGVLYYDIVVTSTGYTSDTYRIYCDHRNINTWRGLTLYYRNSFGGIDNIKLLGVNEVQSGIINKKTAVQKRAGIGIRNSDGPVFFFESDMQFAFKASTGYISKQHKAALAELFNTTFAAILLDGTWLSMSVPEQNMEPMSTEDMLHEYEIYFTTAGTFKTMPKELLRLI